MATDAIIDEIASRQRGRVARWQLLQAGVNRAAIARRTASGRLVSVFSGVYAVSPVFDVPLAPETEALLACRPGAALSHHSAAILWGLRKGTADPVHVTVPANRSGPRGRRVQVHRSQILTPRDIDIEQGLPVTSVPFTLLDVAATVSIREMELMLDEALFVHKLVKRREIESVLARAGGHNGRGLLGTVLAAHKRSTKTDSDTEERFLAIVRAAGLPAPEQQAWVLGHKLDFYWREQRVAVETDAYGTHGSPRKFESARTRDAELWSKRRIHVLRITRLRIRRDMPGVTAQLVRSIDPGPGPGPL